jgi:amino acid transporter
MDTWPEMKILDFSLKTRVTFIVIYIVFNVIFYVLFKKKDINNKLLHKLTSLINIFAGLFILIICLYQLHILFIIFAPFIIMYITLFGYGLNTELSDEDKAGLVVNKSISLPTNLNTKYSEFIFFPGYYLMESWKNKQKRSGKYKLIFYNEKEKSIEKK